MKWFLVAVTTAGLLVAMVFGLSDVGADQSAIIVEQRGGPTVASHSDDDRVVRVVVHADRNRLGEVVDRLVELDGSVLRIVGNIVEADVPAGVTDLITSVEGVRLVDHPAVAVETAVVGEGFSLVGAPEWHEAGFTGEGTTVAVIDSGFDGWDRAAVEGDVPIVPVDDRIDLCDLGFEATPHGTATAEIVAEIAPDARLVLACIDDALDLSLAVDALIERDVNVINMSLGFYNSSRGDGTGGEASPDQSAARAMAANIVWVNSAGNEGRSHYHADFLDTDGDGRHEYAPGDELLAFSVPANAEANVMAKWDDWPLTDQDFDICLTQRVDVEPTCYGRTQQGVLPPHETVRISNPFDHALTMYLSMQRQSGTSAPRIDVFVLGGEDLEYVTGAGSIAEPASAPGVIAVGALCPASGSARDFSSRGPTISGSTGISLVGPEPISSAVYGPAEGCEGGYGGTSASAPHAAGAAALLIDAHPGQSANWIRSELFRRAALEGDPGELGVDPVYGHGMVNLSLPPQILVGGDRADPSNTANPSEPFELSPEAEDSSAARGHFRISADADRSNGELFDGQTVDGEVFVFLDAHEERPARVEYFVGDILMQVERFAGFDLGGGTDDRAFPFDTTRLDNGPHRLEAHVQAADGSVVTYATEFVVANGSADVAQPFALVSLAADGTRSTIDGAHLGGPVFVELAELAPVAGVGHVTFYIDAELVGYDGAAPYELGGIVAGRATAFDVDRLAAGQHMIQAIAHLDDGGFLTATASFTTG